MSARSLPPTTLLLVPLLVCMVLPPTDGPRKVAQRDPGIPERIPSKPGYAAEFAWLSASSLVDSDGRLVAGSDLPELTRFLIPRLRRTLERGADAGGDAGRAEATPSGCVDIGSVKIPLTPGTRIPGTVNELVERSEAILVATVDQVAGGLYMATRPGILFRLRDQEWLKPSTEYPDSGTNHVFLPVGQFNLGATPVCINHGGWPPPPRVGDRVMLFPQSGPLDARGQILNVHPVGYEVVYETARSLSAPARLRQLPALTESATLDDFRARVAAALGTLGSGPGGDEPIPRQ